jgi:hypothetical protein
MVSARSCTSSTARLHLTTKWLAVVARRRQLARFLTRVQAGVRQLQRSCLHAEIRVLRFRMNSRVARRLNTLRRTGLTELPGGI